MGKIKKSKSKTKSKSSSPFSSSDSGDSDVFHEVPNYAELVKQQKFTEFAPKESLVTTMDANEFTIDYIHRNGIKNPIIFTEQQDILGIKIPNFSYSEVLSRIPPHTEIDIFNHANDKQRTMPVSTIVSELEKPVGSKRNGPYNMLSLECSGWEMSGHISPPTVVREIDWAQTVFPKDKFAHRDYSKVEKYILMTMANSYTDFHIDFGGTSVWYHVQRGEKYFFVIEPTAQNVRLFEEWMSAYQAGTYTGFFGDVIQKCQCVKMSPGNTLILPAGWIHAVYTPVDSLVYGGNFLHEYSISMQMRIKKKFKYPYYEQTVWYFAADVVRKATGRNYVCLVSSEHLEELRELPRPETECYDLPNENWECYNEWKGDPCQRTFDPIDGRLNDEPQSYNDEYLAQQSPMFRKELYKLQQFLRRILDNRNRKKDRIAEGIRRPRHLILDLERVVDRLMEPLSPSADLSIEPAVLVANRSTQKTPDPNISSVESNVAQSTDHNPAESDKIDISIDESKASELEHTNTSSSKDESSLEMPEIKKIKVEGMTKLVKETSSTETGRKRPLSSEKKKTNGRASTLNKPSTPGSDKRSHSRGQLKYRRHESPLPSATTETTPLPDDPINTAVPLGRGQTTRKDYVKLNSINRPPKHVNSTPKTPQKQQINQNSSFLIEDNNPPEVFYFNDQTPMLKPQSNGRANAQLDEILKTVGDIPKEF
ncbi:JmjC domain-containing protein [Aphelenchoides besseyi]|nr:JmjC domain-containing protein [Aphelenchoides besseyi]